ncbi:MAG: hypothetical protein DIU75_019640 [Mycolicibacterium hassiacum]
MPVPTKVNVRSRPQAFGYDAMLQYGPSDNDTLYLRLAAGPGRQLQIETADPAPPRISTDENPEDMTQVSGRVFSRNNWSGGSGLDRAHRRDGTAEDYSRFWDSRNIDVSPPRPGEPAVIRLLHSVGQLSESASGRIAEMDGALFCAAGTAVIRIENPTGSPSEVVEDPHASQPAVNVNDLCRLGSVLYAALGASGIHHRVGGTWSHWSDVEAVRVWAVKRRILAATSDGRLYEARDGGDSVLLHTLGSGSAWTAVVDGGSHILAAADDGYVYAFAVGEDGSLRLAGESEFVDEAPVGMGAYEGIVLVGTEQRNPAGGSIGRLWRAAVSPAGLLVSRQLLREWGDTSSPINFGPRWMLVDRDEIFTVVREDNNETHLWRYMLATGGLVRDLIVPAGGDPNGLVMVADRKVITVADAGVYREEDTYAHEGWLVNPAADFYTAAEKRWVGVRLLTDRAGLGEVLVDVSTDFEALTNPRHPTWRMVMKASFANPGTEQEHRMKGVVGRWLVSRVTLRRAADGRTPAVKSMAFRGLLTPEELIVQLPVNVSDRLELPRRKPRTVNGLGHRTWEALKRIEGQDVRLELFRPQDQIYGQVESVSTPILQTALRGSSTVYCLVTVRGRRGLPRAAMTGAGFGTHMWGVRMFGGAHG